jgi:hypothetical protein
VRLIGDVDAQRRQRASGNSELANLQIQRFARGGKRGEAGDGCGIVDDAHPFAWQAEQPPEPAHRYLFQLGSGR